MFNFAVCHVWFIENRVKIFYGHLLLLCFLERVELHVTTKRDKREREKGGYKSAYVDMKSRTKLETIKLEPYQGDTIAVMLMTDWQ